MSTTADALPPAVLVELRAALEAGAAPAAALVAVGDAAGPALARVARSVHLGRPIAEVAGEAPTGHPQTDLLVRALGVAERAGAGGADAVAQAIRAAEEDRRLHRLLRVRTAQARGTARILSLVPLAVWLLIVAVDVRALRFYATPLGAGTAIAAIALVAAGHRWARRIVDRASTAAAAADPLAPAPAPRDPVRAAVLGLPALVVLGVGVHPLLGIVAGVVGAAIGCRPRADAGVGADGVVGRDGGAAEAVELVAVGLAAGMPADGAVRAVAGLAPPAARPALAAAARRLRDGWDAGAAFDGTGLAELGAVLEATGRWGAPAETALRRLAADLRARRRAAAEEAAERTQLALVFPTTLLILPAFGLAVVPPMVWSALSSAAWSA